MSDTASRPRLLLVDDERLIRSAYSRQLRDRFEVVTAQGGDEALARLTSEDPFAAVIADLRMPGLDGLTLLQRAREACPDTVRILFTGQADLLLAVRAVNEAGVFRILLKPCPPARLWECLDAAVEQFARARAAREQATRAAGEATTLLATLVERVNPPLHARLTRLRRVVRHMCVALGIAEAERFDPAVTACGLGQLAFDRPMLDRFVAHRPSDAQEAALFEGQWALSADIAGRVDGLRDVAEMVRGAAGPGDPCDAPARVAPVPLGAQLLRVAAAFDGLVAQGLTRDDALSQMRSQLCLPLRLVDGLMDIAVLTVQWALERRRVADLEVGMILDEPVRTAGGLKLAPAGQRITPALLQVLEGYTRTIGVVEPLLVRVAVNR